MVEVEGWKENVGEDQECIIEGVGWDQLRLQC